MLRPRPVALVAEDTELGRWALAHALRAEGYDVCVSAGWTETDGWLDRAAFDVVVMAVSSTRDNVAHIVDHARREHGQAGLILLALQDDAAAVRAASGPEPVVLAKPLDVAAVVLTARALAGPGDVAKGA